MTVYDYSLPLPSGETLPLSNYEGKLLLIVNTATKCGYTPQYEELENLYKKYKDKGLEIIDIPCNQFAEQAKGTDEEITSFCTLKYGTTFTRVKKSDVNGENALPLYTYLKECCPFKGFGKGAKAFMMGALLKTIDKDYKNNPNIKWNFTKFLINKEGVPIARFEPNNSLKDLEEAIVALL